MRGLLIKDFFCLKKQLTTYAFIIAGVIAVSIMFVLSYRFGNIHAGFLEMVESGESTQTEVVSIASAALLLFMMLPIACTGDIGNLFLDDEKASFYKVASSLPISVRKRVACRFIAGILFIAIGFLVDLIMTLILSSLTDVISFQEFLGVMVSFASIMLMYISLLILFMYLLGNKKNTYASVFVLLIGLVVYVLINWNKIRVIVFRSDDSAIMDVYYGTVDFIEHRFYILFLFSLLVLSSSYMMAVKIANRKRGVC